MTDENMIKMLEPARNLHIVTVITPGFKAFGEYEEKKEDIFIGDVLDLINRQKSEAIKEFAKRLKAKAKMPLGTLYGKLIYVKDIDSLVEEMTERKDEGK